MHIPVIMYHSVAPKGKTISNDWLTTDINLFEKQLKYLKNKNYKTISLKDLYDFKFKNKKIHGKPIILTFDDGYLDNYTFAYPLLKKYGFNATIFVNPSFIIEGKKRKNFEKIGYDYSKISKLDYIGYLNWDEIIEMENSGVIDIQSHSMTHTSYFFSDKVIDILSNKNISKYYWFFWNHTSSKKEKVKWMDKKNFPEFLKSYKGYPIFKFGNSLKIRKFVPSKEIIELSQGLTKKNIHNKKIIKILNKSKIKKGSFEKDSEMIKRYNFELEEPKKILSQKLKKEILFLCWPCGAFNKKSLLLSEKYYSGFTINEIDGFKINFNINSKTRKIYRCNDGKVYNLYLSFLFFKIILFCHDKYKYKIINFFYLSFLAFRSIYKKFERILIK